MTEQIVIFGSSRADGNTKQVVDQVMASASVKYKLIHLNDYRLSYFDYNLKYDDDFLEIYKQMIEQDLIVLATPVYWYSMSAQMKIFIDRLTDFLLDEELKPLGRQLRGKRMLVIASHGQYAPSGFEEVFKLTAEYLGMVYEGCCLVKHSYNEKENEELVEANQKQISKAKSVIESVYSGNNNHVNCQ